MGVTRSCVIRVPVMVPFRCASRSGAGVSTGVPFQVAPSGWSASPRDCTRTANPHDRVRLHTPPVLKKAGVLRVGGVASARAIPGCGRVRHSHWHGPASSAVVSRSRAMPAGRRRSKPSPRFFRVGGIRFRSPAGLHLRGLRVGRVLLLAPAPSWDWRILIMRRASPLHPDAARAPVELMAPATHLSTERPGIAT